MSPDSSREMPTNMMQFFAARMERSSPHAKIAEHVTPGHIDKSLDIADKQNERVAVDRSETRTFQFRLVVVAAVFILALVSILVFSDNAALMQNLIEWMAVGGMGWAGGYGWAKRRAG